MRLNRRWSRALTRWLATLPVTPNQVTVTYLIVGIAALSAFAYGTWWSAVLGALLLECGYLLDNCDGELARLRGATTTFGTRLDTAVDTVVHVSLFPAIAAGLLRQGLSRSLATAGWVGAASTLVIYGMTMAQERRQMVGSLPGWHEGKDVIRTDYALLVLLCALAGWLPGLLWISSVGACCLCGAMAIHAWRGGRII